MSIRSNNVIVVTGERLRSPLSSLAWASVVSLAQLKPTYDEGPPDEEDNQPRPCTNPIRIENDISADQEAEVDFNAKKAAVAAAIADLGKTFRGTVTIGGQTLLVSAPSSHFGNYLAQYAFYWNTSLNSQAGNGGSFNGFAIVDPRYLNDGAFTEAQIQNSFPGSDMHGERIWNWVILHEVAHQYLDSAGVYDALWAEHGSVQSGWLASTQFALHEKLTNDLVRAIADAARLPLPGNLPGGEGAMSITQTDEASTPTDPRKLPDGDENPGGDCSNEYDT